MLTAAHFERVLAMCIVLLGDFWQLPVADKDAARCTESQACLPHVKTIPFHEQVRCKCPKLQHKLDILRTDQHSMKQLKKILREHRAWKANDPTAYDTLDLFRKQENTIIVSCSRQACAKANALALEAFFEHRHKRPIGRVLFDYEAHLENYEGGTNKLKAGRLTGAETNIYEGIRVFLTKNMDEENNFVNGMAARVEAYDTRSKYLEVLTRTGQRLAMHMVSNELEDGCRVTSYPVRLGYACTIPKVQGMTPPHVTMWLDSIACRAAASVAMSRVQKDEDYLIAGGPLTPKHFVPAQQDNGSDRVPRRHGGGPSVAGQIENMDIRPMLCFNTA